MELNRSALIRCRSCGAQDLDVVLDLGLVPASDTFPWADDPEPDPRFPLELYRCGHCTLLQLGPRTVLAPETPTAVDSATAVAHAELSVSSIIREERLVPGQSVVELDSGHGNSWLPAFLQAGLVEGAARGRADLVVDLHHLMHEQSLDPVLATHRSRLAPGGALVCEFFYGASMIENRLVDTIRHGHFLYLSLTSLLPALQRHGLTATRAVAVDVYGGSLRVTSRPTRGRPEVDRSVGEVLAAEAASGLTEGLSTAAFAAEAQAVGDEFHTRLKLLAATGHTVAGYGAPSKAAVLLALAGVGKELLPFTVDLSPAKAGRRIPGAGVPIRPVSALLEERPDVVVVLTWDIASEIAGQLTALAEGTDWRPTLYVPLPRPLEIQLG